MAIPNTSEKSNALDREENITKGNLSAKRVVLYTYDSTTDTIVPSTTTSILITKIDTTTTAGVTYIGKAAPSSSTASAVWQIKKLDSNTLALDKTWADGNDLFDNVWNNREALTYS